MSVHRQQPLLAVPHGPLSVPTLQIVEAASGLCELLWLVDESVPGNAVTTRLLRKVGTVVNVADQSLEETVSVLREHAPDGVVAYRDSDILLVSLIAEELGLDYHTPEVARRLLDKLTQRETLRNGGLPSPLCWEVPADLDPAAVEAFATAVQYPAVLKPRRSSGGRYTTPVADDGDLVRQIAMLPPEAGGEMGMFVEQYLPSLTARPSGRFGDYVSVESLVAAGEISHVAVTGRFPLAEPFRETGLFIPAEISHAQLLAVLEVATAALGALGVRTGCLHTEIKLTPDGPRVLEVNGRLGGGVPEMLFQASGVSLVKLSMRVALGEPVAVDGPIPCARVGWCLLSQPPTSARRVVSVEGLDRLAGRPGVNEVFVNRAPGDRVDSRAGTRQYVYSVFGVSEDYDRLLEINRFLHEEVSIVYD